MTPVCDSPSPLRDDSSSAQAHAVTNTSVTDTRVTDVIPLPHTLLCNAHSCVCLKHNHVTDTFVLQTHLGYRHTCVTDTCVTDTLVLQTHMCYRHTCVTDTLVLQTHLCYRHTCVTDTLVLHFVSVTY